MSVAVKWFPTLIKRTKSRKAETSVDWVPGLTPFAIFTSEGFNEADMEPVMVVINGEQSVATARLNDGDQLEFLVSIQGG